MMYIYIYMMYIYIYDVYIYIWCIYIYMILYDVYIYDVYIYIYDVYIYMMYIYIYDVYMYMYIWCVYIYMMKYNNHLFSWEQVYTGQNVRAGPFVTSWPFDSPVQLGQPWAIKIWTGKTDSYLSQLPTGPICEAHYDSDDRDREVVDEELPSLSSCSGCVKHFEHLGPAGSSVRRA